MFRRFLGAKKDSDSFSPPEEVTVARLAASHRRLIIDEGRLETQSEAGLRSVGGFLENLDHTASALQVEKAPRAYRSSFTVNYRALFPDEARSYRVDVLEASAEQYAVIWVNGDKFEFSPEAMRRADALQRSWSEVGVLLEHFSQASERAKPCERPKRNDLRRALCNLDFAWASFEEKYISELIEIEEKARRLIVQAIEHEQKLTNLESQHRGKGDEALQNLPEYREQQKSLVRCITHLNTVANTRRKGRDDLEEKVLFDAIKILCQCEAAERAGQDTEALVAAGILAADVVESFAALRCYLREVQGCIERVDPHLCNNAGLVERLVDWEESWELGARYVQRPALLAAVCDLVAEVRNAQQLAPALEAMCEQCDAELFMVLPRIAWLRFLVKPETQAEFLGDLLPHRFAAQKQEGGGPAPEQAPRFDPEVLGLLRRFQQVRQLLLRSPDSAGQAAADEAVWAALVRRVVSGVAGGPDGAASVRDADSQAGPQAAVDGLVHELERWSMELQRHCPEDWNQCCAILVRCLVGGDTVRERHKEVTFRV